MLVPILPQTPEWSAVLAITRHRVPLPDAEMLIAEGVVRPCEVYGFDLRGLASFDEAIRAARVLRFLRRETLREQVGPRPRTSPRYRRLARLARAGKWAEFAENLP